MIHPIWKQLEHIEFHGGYHERVKYYNLFASKNKTFTSPLPRIIFVFRYDKADLTKYTKDIAERLVSVSLISFH